MSRPHPPRLLTRFLARSIPPDSASGPSLLGDLDEEYRVVQGRWGTWAGGAWYLVQALSIGIPFRLRSAAELLGRSAAGLGLDLRITARGLGRSPGLVVVATLSLALGLGLTSAATGLVNAIWWAPLPYPEASRLVDVRDHHDVEVCRGCSPGTSWAAFAQWRTDVPAFEVLTAARGTTLEFDLDGRPVGVRGAEVTPNRHALLGFRAALGRTLAPDDGAPGAPAVVVLSHGLWVELFGADLDVIGRSIRIGERMHTVVGVLDRSTRPLDRARAWVPLQAGAMSDSYADRGLCVVGRLAPGVGVQAANASLSSLAEARYSEAPDLKAGWSARVQPLRRVLASGAATPAVAASFFGTALLVLLVACLNLATLLLARATARERELGVRAALGAGRARVARAALMEAAVLAVLGGAGGLAAARLGASALLARHGAELPGWVQFPVDGRVLAGSLLLTLLAAVVSGALPLLQALRIGGDAGVAGRLGRHARRGHLRRYDLLLAVQVAVGVVLVAGSTASVRSFLRASDFDTLGQRWEGITSITVSPPDELAPEDWPHRVAALEQALAARPEVSQVTVVRSLFLGSWGGPAAASPVRVDGHAEAVPNAAVPRHSLAVSDSYFDLYGIRLVTGRGFGAGSGSEGPAAVVSRAAAEALWPGRPLDQVPGQGFTISVGATVQPFTVVGVSADIVVSPTSESRTPSPRFYTRLADTDPGLFAQNAGAPIAAQIVLREGASVSEAAWARTVAEAGPDLVLGNVTTAEAILRDWIEPLRVTAWVLGALAALALALLVLGVHGTLSYRIAASRHGVAIRVALGARNADVVRAMAGRVGRVLGLALATGLVASVALGQASRGGPPLGTTHPDVLLAVTGLLLLAGVLAAAPPLRRALRSDPAQALRPE